MLGGAVGDALGAGVRQRSAVEIQRWFGPQGVGDYLPVFGPRGAVTELTQLTVFTLEALLRAKAVNPDPAGWLPTQVVGTNHLRWLYTQGVPWNYAMSAHLQTHPEPSGWLLERPELFSTRNPAGTAMRGMGLLAAYPPEPGAEPRPPLGAEGFADCLVWAAPTMVWNGSEELVFAAGAAVANLLTADSNVHGAAGLHGDVLAQLIRGTRLWDAVSAAETQRLGRVYCQDQVPADVRRTVRAAMFTSHGGRPGPAELDVAFDTEGKPGELGIALASVACTDTFADAVWMAVNQSADSSVAGALAGQLAGALHGPEAIPRHWLDDLELREIIEVLCEDASEAFAPPPMPKWAQRYVDTKRHFAGPLELTDGDTNTVDSETVATDPGTTRWSRPPAAPELRSAAAWRETAPAEPEWGESVEATVILPSTEFGVDSEPDGGDRPRHGTDRRWEPLASEPLAPEPVEPEPVVAEPVPEPPEPLIADSFVPEVSAVREPGPVREPSAAPEPVTVPESVTAPESVTVPESEEPEPAAVSEAVAVEPDVAVSEPDGSEPDPTPFATEFPSLAEFPGEREEPDTTPKQRGHAKVEDRGPAAPSLTDRVAGCLLGGALGNALGADIEMVGSAEIAERFGPDGPYELPGAFGVRGAVTDDTQLTLFTAEGLIRGGIAQRRFGADDPLREVQLAYQRWLHTQGVPWESAAGAFLAEHPVPDGWLIEVPELFAVRGPGNTVFSALAGFGEGNPVGSFAQVLNDSKGSGAVMRVTPVALCSADPAEVFTLAARVAALTHGHPTGYHASGALAVIVQQALVGNGLDDGIWCALQVLETWDEHEETSAMLKLAVDLASRGIPGPQQIEQNLGGGWVGEQALAIAVCAAVAGGDDFELALRVAVHHSGDSDTTGSICGSILGALRGAGGLPQAWLDELELRDVIEQVAVDCVAGFGDPESGAEVEQPSADWSRRYPVRPQRETRQDPPTHRLPMLSVDSGEHGQPSAPAEVPEAGRPEASVPIGAGPVAEFPAPKPSPRRINGVMPEHDG